MKQSQTERIEFLDYMKAVCVIMVIVTHYNWSDKTSPVFSMIINMAVPIFMIISGYNFAMSNQRKADGKLRTMYRWNLIKPKLVRFLIPFLTICGIEILLLWIEDKNIHPFRIFLLGAYGPGSYYVPIMIQLLLIFPIIYKLVSMNAKLGILLSALANVGYEVAIQIFDIDKYFYRLGIGRYLLLIAFGCYLYLYPRHRVKVYQLVCMFFVGAAYILSVVTFEQEIPVFEYWRTTAMPVAFYIFPIVILLFRNFYHCRIPGWVGKFLTLIGKASYHIFLVQMVYYHFELGGYMMKAVWYIAIPFHLVVNITGGLLFYELDGIFMNYVKQRKYLSRIFN